MYKFSVKIKISRSLMKIAAVILTGLFVLGDIPLSAQIFSSRSSVQALAPDSIFRPIVSIERRGGEFIIVEDETEKALMTEKRKEDVGFIYLCMLISQVLEEYNGVISSEGLIRLIEQHLEHIDFTRYRWREMYEYGNTFCLPYSSASGRETFILRFYLKGNNDLSDGDGYVMPIGPGSVRVTFGRVADIRSSDELMKYFDNLRQNASFEDVLSHPEQYEKSFFKPLFDTLFQFLVSDFNGTAEFINICRKVIEEEGTLELRRRINNGDADLVDALKRMKNKIKYNMGSDAGSIDVYGILFFFIVNTPEHIAGLQSAIQDLYDESVENGFLKAPDVRTMRESVFHQRGEEVFFAGGRDFTFEDLRRWPLRGNMRERFEEEYLRCVYEREGQEAEGTVQDVIYSALEDVFIVDGRRHKAIDLMAEGMSGDVIYSVRELAASEERSIQKAIEARKSIREKANWALKYLYDEFMTTRDVRDIALAKRGVSHHIAGHNTVHLFPKRLIFEGDKAVFMDSLVYKYGETKPLDAMHSDNACKINEAVRVWGQASPASDATRQRFMEEASVVELDAYTSLLVSDPVSNVVRPLQVGRSRGVFYISGRYLDQLDINNEEDMKELAFILKLGQSFIDKYDEAEKEKKSSEEVQDVVFDFNEHFLKAAGESLLVDPMVLRKRLSDLMASDFIVKYTDMLEEVLKDEQKVTDINAGIAASSPGFIEKRAALKEVFQINYNLLTRYSGLRMDGMAHRAYSRLRRSARELQIHDNAGLMPYYCQVVLVFAALKLGCWDDYLVELESLLTGKDFPRAVTDEEKALAREISMPTVSDGMSNLEEELKKALKSQINVMHPENADMITRKTDELLAEASGMVASARKNEDMKSKGTDARGVIARARVLDLKGHISRDDALLRASEEAEKVTGVAKEELFRKLIERESQGSTAIAPGIALPHVVLDPGSKYEAILVRASEGISFDGANRDVNAMFVLMGPRVDEKDASLHLRVMMDIAETSGKKDFMEKWMNASSPEDLKAIFSQGEGRDVEQVSPEDEQNDGAISSDIPEQDAQTQIEAGSPGSEIMECERGVAQDLVDTMIRRIKLQAMDAQKRDEKILIGIDVSWIPEEQRASVMKGLMNRLSHLRRKEGFTNIIIRRRKGSRLAGAISEELGKENNIPTGNIILLGDKKVLEKKAFNKFRDQEKMSERAFFGAVDSKGIKDNSYIRLVEMLDISLRLAFGEEVSEGGHPNVRFFRKDRKDPRYYVLIPDAIPFNYAGLEKIYHIQRDLIDSRA